jgi:hypothetical protein
VKDFDRLVETSPHALTRELLNTGLEDSPPASAAPRVAAALGLSASIAAVGVPALGAGSAVVAGASPLGVAAVVKWLGMGLLAGTVVSGGAALTRRSAPPPARSVAATTTPSPAAATPLERRAGRDGVQRTEAGAPVAATPPAPPAPLALAVPPGGARVHSARNEPAVAAVPSAASALAYEVARIDEARVALRGGNALAALAALARYDEERQTRVLDREAAVLRIEALRSAGRTNDARAQASRYVDRFPSDAHSASLRLFLGESDGAQGIDR